MREVAFGSEIRLLRIGLFVYRDGIPDFREQPVESHPLVAARIEHFGAGNQRFHRRGHIGVAGGLVAGQGAGITAQERQVLEYGL